MKTKDTDNLLAVWCKELHSERKISLIELDNVCGLLTYPINKYVMDANTKLRLFRGGKKKT